MALTKVTGQVINNSTDLVVGVTTVGGGVSAVDGFFSGIVTFSQGVSIGGTLTYEDVTNIDSVGLITARAGIVVGSGITLSKDGDVFFTGIATGNGSGLTALNASNISSGTVPTARLGSGTASSSTFLRGDSTFQTVNTDLVSDTSPQLGGELDTNGNDIRFADTDEAIFGNGADLKIYHEGGSGDNIIKNNIAGKHLKIQHNDGSASATFYNNSSVELYYAGTKHFETTSSGATITGNLAFPSGNGIDFSATSDLSGSSSELLDDYEEGTYTCVLTGSTGGTHNIVGCPYVKIGKQVSIQVTMANPGSNSISGYWSFTMPFQAVQTSGFAYFGGYVTYTRHMPGFSAGDGNFTNYALHTYNGQSSALFYKLRNGSGEANLISGSLNTEAILAWTMVYNTST